MSKGEMDGDWPSRRAGSPRAGRGRRAIERAASHWAARSSLGELADEDRLHFLRWLDEDPAHAPAYERMTNALASLDRAGPIVREADRRARQQARARKIRQTSAALALVCTAWLGTLASIDIPAEFADHRTQRGERRALMLADGSRLLLDADSAVDIDYDSRDRRIHLIRGRVHADVRHGDRRPFRIAALKGEIEDVGTGFDVALGKNEASVVVTQGEVLARSGGRQLGLVKGQGGRWSKDGPPLRLQRLELEEAMGWPYGRLIFDRRPFGEVVAMLDRYSRKPVWLWGRKAAARRVSGVVRADAVDSSLASLAKAQGLRYRNLGIAIILY